MQKKFILKIILVSMATLSTSSAASLSNDEITNMTSKIKGKRAGVTLGTLENTTNPFIIQAVKKAVTEEKNMDSLELQPPEIVYTLKAVLNRAAFINEKWYREGDTIGSYTVGHVSSHSTVLKSSTGNKVLNLEKKKLIKLNRGYR